MHIYAYSAVCHVWQVVIWQSSHWLLNHQNTHYIMVCLCYLLCSKLWWHSSPMPIQKPLCFTCMLKHPISMRIYAPFLAANFKNKHWCLLNRFYGSICWYNRLNSKRMIVFNKHLGSVWFDAPDFLRLSAPVVFGFSIFLFRAMSDFSGGFKRSKMLELDKDDEALATFWH